MAIKAVDSGLKWGGWVLEVDVQGYFDNISHKMLRDFLDQRVKDGVLRRMIDKWLRVGISENKEVTYSEVGTPQGGVISPLLSNIFLHNVLDEWFEGQVKPRMVGSAELVRFADDFIIMFSREDEARKVLEVLKKRFEKYGLTVHPEKTRLTGMVRPSGGSGKEKGETLDFLGFTLYWGTSRRGKRILKLKTAKDRQKKCLMKMTQWCRRNRHWKIKDQAAAIAKKLEGHYQYYGVSHNWLAMSKFRDEVIQTWKKWLMRRSQKGGMSWESFKRRARPEMLPRPHITVPLF